MIPFLKKFLTKNGCTYGFDIKICYSKRSYLPFISSCYINEKPFLRGVFGLQSWPIFACRVISMGCGAKPWWSMELSKTSLDRSWQALFYHIQDFNLLPKMWPLGLLKNGKNRHVKYMFFANIFVNIDHRETNTKYNFVHLIKIHKFNSMHFLAIVNSFRVLGYQMCEKRLLLPCHVSFWQISSLILIIKRSYIEYNLYI